MAKAVAMATSTAAEAVAIVVSTAAEAVSLTMAASFLGPFLSIVTKYDGDVRVRVGCDGPGGIALVMQLVSKILALIRTRA